ncbi:ATP-dependent DNA helicase [Acetobacterium tundrae]|uniref:DEAD/DEAH box helicase n=1 Tax=Acetobacterium tundrae TaxID=132932 RepID=A0ABR6WMD2_9FIRM|nr:ATP-dependent DNA helicase [Acetobacterium tundrae]MBC3797471.1 DEAD/DEAH box helicase [Acetobacterium tundrae]
MTKQPEIKLSVRNLVEFILRSGNIDSQFMSNSRALEGTRAHQKIQKDNKNKGYEPEVSLKYTVDYQGFTFKIEGRADGIITKDDLLIVDEIKSTNWPLEYLEENYNETHWAQAKCYAFIYSVQNNIEQIGAQLTYYQLESEEIKQFLEVFSQNELTEFFYKLIDQYLIWASLTSDWVIKRDDSIKALDFPFEDYRKGQRKLAVSVYRTISEHKKIFVQAPTGIGKTISTLFPAIKAVAEGHTSKLFYLTAKTIVREVAEEAFSKMKEKGLEFKTVTLTAKDKLCFQTETICDPDHCEFAKGHFDRVNNALLDCLQQENHFTRPVIENYARKHQICPFEFSLDLTLWSDCVICDYNYVFDPRVYLKRFFMDNGGDYTFLIDEAHNLVDRARSMFSAELYKKPILKLKRIFQDKEPGIAKSLDKLNAYMITMRKLADTDHHYLQKDEPKEVYPLIMRFISESEEWLAKNEGREGHEQLLELYFTALTFMRTAEFYDERYITYVENSYGDTRIKLFCLDPSYLLSEAIKRGKSAVFFSATLSPIDYFSEILGGREDCYKIILPSPFAVNNRALLIADHISTKYRNREESYFAIAECIKTVYDQKFGNYIAYFPSYQYMNDVYDAFSEKYPDIYTIKQLTEMNEKEREHFLSLFKSDARDGVLGFCVLGGIFSEGVDLKHEELVGAMIVGVGLPQICFERNIIRDYFNEKNQRGFEYSYQYPGMNKVLQAAGRVIRTETDKGIILLIDDRFSNQSYQQLFPMEWFPHTRVVNSKELRSVLKEFWENS